MRRPKNTKTGITAYLCECGEKRTFPKAEINASATKQCKCGRTIVMHHGVIYGTRKG